ncbi:mannose-6-phosphate isomerase [Erythrobacter litoralis]|uniref:Mannose-6-phosphate isomerase n=1 Tax=Erythrobacter litoralis TaxID=39960 RepID=A0A074M983_9SPHN|nr:class I mannose-6-phosphate isomerase [Erythrobacter litoralis]AOL24643.1 mannose-6-phosphate isomerase [Erythrobacter litoralis]KEO89325.1 mannose-6-phosphate isomerase [Erythrobacter litoralis]MEE4337705.1 class I mannose-6-phosphate isomerase [Erythrobacter sp.]
MSGPVHRLPTRMVEKVWGRDHLPLPFEALAGTRIGEIWFEPPPELPQVLVKYLFTSEKLSVQVHPSDANALPGEAGKEECWLVLDAEPGAKLAIGFREQVRPDRIEAAALDGSIEDLLEWHEAKPGDLFYLPAGTVHAIGPGLVLVEVQQSSDTTFRLYDYGRPRELHLDRAMAVAKGEPYAAEYRGSIAERGERLVDGPFFRLDRIEGVPSDDIAADYSAPLLALPLEGSVAARTGQARARPGECLCAPEMGTLDFSNAGITLLTRARSLDG